jgi:hypothetical protein
MQKGHIMRDEQQPTAELVRRITTSLREHLETLEAIGALVAAAHLDAAIEACNRQFGLGPNTPTSD